MRDSLEHRSIPREHAPAKPGPVRTETNVPTDSVERRKGAPKSSQYEPSLADLTPTPRTHFSEPSNRRGESLRQQEFLLLESTQPQVRLPPATPVTPPVRVSADSARSARGRIPQYEPTAADLEPPRRVQQPKPEALAVPPQGLSVRPPPSPLPTPAPSPLPSPPVRVETPGAPTVKKARQEEYLPSFETLPGAHGPPGPTPRAIEALQQRGILTEDAGTPPRPKIHPPEPTGPSASALSGLQRRGILPMEDPPSAVALVASQRPADAISSRPRQAEILASQHQPPPDAAETTVVTPSPTVERQPPDQDRPKLNPPPPTPTPAPSPVEPSPDVRHLTPDAGSPAPRSTRPRIWRVRRPKDCRVQHTLCIPFGSYTQLCELAEQRGTSTNAVILSLLTEAGEQGWSGQGPAKAKPEPTARVRRTLRIPRPSYQKLEAMARQAEVHVNFVMLAVLAQACQRHSRS